MIRARAEMHRPPFFVAIYVAFSCATLAACETNRQSATAAVGGSLGMTILHDPDFEHTIGVDCGQDGPAIFVTETGRPDRTRMRTVTAAGMDNGIDVARDLAKLMSTEYEIYSGQCVETEKKFQQKFGTSAKYVMYFVMIVSTRHQRLNDALEVNPQTSPDVVQFISVIAGEKGRDIWVANAMRPSAEGKDKGVTMFLPAPVGTLKPVYQRNYEEPAIYPGIRISWPSNRVSDGPAPEE